MVEEKLPQQIYNVLEKSYETFYDVVFLEVCKTYRITLIGFNMKKTPCVDNPSKNFLAVVGEGISGCSVQLIELIITESVQKLFDLETEISLCTVQEDWLLKTKNHLVKYERKLLLIKLKKIRMLVNTDDLYFACLERFESHCQFFRLDFSIFVKVSFLILKIYIIFYI